MKVTHKNTLITLPDFMIVGAPKAGSTSLFYYLDANPRLTFTKVKEPHFFLFRGNDVSKNNLMSGITGDLKTYQSWMPSYSDNVLIGEGSVNYLAEYETVIPHIKELYGDQFSKLKIIILLRNPVDRAWSHYMHFVRDQREDLPFLDAISPETIKKRSQVEGNFNFFDYIGKGMYANQVAAYKSTFPNVKIIQFEDLIKDTETIVSQITSFLGVENDITLNKKVYNSSGELRNPFIKRIYAKYSQKDSVRRATLMKIIPVELLQRGDKMVKRVMSKFLTKRKMSDEQRITVSNLYEKDTQDLNRTLGLEI